jgi:hypothetical protein
MNRLMGKLLSRLDDATPRGTGAKAGVELLSAFYFSTNEQGRDDGDWGNNSLPSNSSLASKLAKYLLPVGIGGVPGHGGISVEILTPRYHLNRHAVVSLPLRGMFGTRFGAASENEYHALLGLTPRWERKQWMGMSSAGFEIGYWDDISHSINARAADHVSYGVTAAVLAKKLRFSLSTLPVFLRPLSRHDYLLTVGVNDVNGIVYWISRLAMAGKP